MKTPEYPLIYGKGPNMLSKNRALTIKLDKSGA